MRVFLYTLILFFLVLNTRSQSNEWFKETTIYQIYPRSFKDSDGDGIGDIQGIINKIDYIKFLGFETIWVSPFFESPQGDFGYDISDYYTIDEDYGNIQLVEKLIQEVHKRDMKIIFDLVLNHTSNQHPWFIESMSSKTNPKADWYVWKDGIKNKPPNNWVNAINKKGWNYVKERDQWYYSSFLDFQPDLNWRNPEVKKEMFNIIKFWLDKGVDGYRLDIFNCIMEDTAFANNPYKFHLLPSRDGMIAKKQYKEHNINHQDNILLAKELREILDSYKNPKRFAIGEAFGPVSAVKPLLGENANGLNFVFLFDMIFYDFNANFFYKITQEFQEGFSEPYLPTIVYSNHDNYRSQKRIDNSINKAKVLAMYQLTSRGLPVVYYGEEIGMTNANIKKKEALDTLSKTFNHVPNLIRKSLPVPLNRDVARTPMQWDTTSKGFSSSTDLWLKNDRPLKDRNVENQLADSSSLLFVYKDLIKLRSTNDALKKGTINLIDPKTLPKDILGYTREYQNKKTLVLLNFSSRDKKIEINSNFNNLIYNLSKSDTINNGFLYIKKYSGAIIE